VLRIKFSYKHIDNMNITEFINKECDCDMGGYYVASFTAAIAFISEILPLIKKIKYNGLIHIFSSKCCRDVIPPQLPKGVPSV